MRIFIDSISDKSNKSNKYDQIVILKKIDNFLNIWNISVFNFTIINKMKIFGFSFGRDKIKYQIKILKIVDLKSDLI